MSRLVNIYHNLNTSEQIQGYQNIEINSINELVNYSINTIHCGCLEYIDSKVLENAISIIFQKLRINGSLILTFSNYKNICKSYSNSSMNNDEFLSLIKNKQNILSTQSIKNICQNIPGSVLSKIENIQNSYKTSIVINRTSL